MAIGGEKQSKLNISEAKNNEQALNKEDEAPKANELTQFEKSVAEIKRLLEAKETKLAPIKKGTDTASQSQQSSLSDELKNPADNPAKDSKSAMKERATNLGKESGMMSSAGNQEEKTQETKPTEPTTAKDMTADQAKAFYPQEYESGATMGFNQGHVEKLQADVIAEQDAQKKKDEAMRSGVGDDGAAYKAGEADAKLAALGHHYPTDSKYASSSAYTRGFNEQYTKSLETAVDAEKKELETNPDFLKGQEVGKKEAQAKLALATEEAKESKDQDATKIAAANKALAEVAITQQEYQGEGKSADSKEKFNLGSTKGFNDAYANTLITNVKNEEEQAKKDLDNSKYYKSGKAAGKKSAEATLSNIDSIQSQNKIEADKAKKEGGEKGDNEFTRGFNDAYVDQQVKNVEKNDFTKKPSFQRGKAVGSIVGALNGKYANDTAVVKGKITIETAVDNHIANHLKELKTDQKVTNVEELKKYILAKSIKVAIPTSYGIMKQLEEADTEEAKKKIMEANKLDASKIAEYEKEKQRYEASLELDNDNKPLSPTEIERRFDLGYTNGYNEGYAGGLEKAVKEESDKFNEDPEYKAGLKEGQKVGEKWINFITEPHDEAESAAFSTQLNAIHDKAKAKGEKFNMGYTYGFNTATPKDAATASKDKALDNAKIDDKSDLAKEYQTLCKKYGDNPEIAKKMEQTFDKYFSEAYDKAHKNYTEPYKNKRDKEQEYQNRLTKAELETELNNSSKTAEQEIDKDQDFTKAIATIKGITKEAQLQFESASQEDKNKSLSGLNETQKAEIQKIETQKADLKKVIQISLKYGLKKGCNDGISYAQGVEVGINISKIQGEKLAKKGNTAKVDEILVDQKLDNFLASEGNEVMFKEGIKFAEEEYGSEFRVRALAKAKGVTDMEYFKLPPRIRTKSGTAGEEKSKSRWWLVYYIQNSLAVPDEIQKLNATSDTNTTETLPNETTAASSEQFTLLRTAAKDLPEKRMANATALTNTTKALIDNFANIKKQDKEDYFKGAILESLKQFDEVPSPELSLSKKLNEQTASFLAVKSHSQPTPAEKQLIDKFKSDSNQLLELTQKSNAERPKVFLTPISVFLANYDKPGIKPSDKTNAAKLLADNITKFCDSFEVDTYDTKSFAELQETIKQLNTTTFNGADVYNSLEEGANQFDIAYGKTYEEILQGIDKNKGLTQANGVGNKIAKEQGEQVGYLQAYFTELINLSADATVVDKNRPNEKNKGAIMVRAMIQEYLDKTTAEIKVTDDKGVPFATLNSLPSAIKVGPTQLIPNETEKEKVESPSKIYYDALTTKSAEAKTDALVSFTYSKRMFTMPLEGAAPIMTETEDGEMVENEVKPVVFVDNAQFLPAKTAEGEVKIQELIEAKGKEAQGIRSFFLELNKNNKTLADILKNTAFFKALQEMQSTLEKSDGFKTLKDKGGIIDQAAFNTFTKNRVNIGKDAAFKTQSNKWDLKMKGNFDSKENDLLFKGQDVFFDMSSDKFENTRYNYLSASSAPQILFANTPDTTKGLNFQIFGPDKKFSVSSGAIQLNYEKVEQSSIKRLTLSIPNLEANLGQKLSINTTDVAKKGKLTEALAEAAKKTYTKEFKLGTSLNTLFNPIDNVLVAKFNTTDKTL